MAEDLSVQHRANRVAFFGIGPDGIIHYHANSYFPYSEGRNCQPGEEFKNGMSREYNFWIKKLLKFKDSG